MEDKKIRMRIARKFQRPRLPLAVRNYFKAKLFNDNPYMSEKVRKYLIDNDIARRIASDKFKG